MINKKIFISIIVAIFILNLFVIAFATPVSNNQTIDVNDVDVKDIDIKDINIKDIKIQNENKFKDLREYTKTEQTSKLIQKQTKENNLVPKVKTELKVNPKSSSIPKVKTEQKVNPKSSSIPKVKTEQKAGQARDPFAPNPTVEQNTELTTSPTPRSVTEQKAEQTRDPFASNPTVEQNIKSTTTPTPESVMEQKVKQIRNPFAPNPTVEQNTEPTSSPIPESVTEQKAEQSRNPFAPNPTVEQNTESTVTTSPMPTAEQSTESTVTPSPMPTTDQNTESTVTSSTDNVSNFADRYKNQQCWNYNLGWNWFFLIIGVMFLIFSPIIIDNEDKNEASIILILLQSVCLFFLFSNILNMVFNINGWITWGVIIGILAILNISIWTSDDWNFPKFQIWTLFALSLISILFIFPMLFMNINWGIVLSFVGVLFIGVGIGVNSNNTSNELTSAETKIKELEGELSQYKQIEQKSSNLLQEKQQLESELNRIQEENSELNKKIDDLNIQIKKSELLFKKQQEETIKANSTIKSQKEKLKKLELFENAFKEQQGETIKANSIITFWVAYFIIFCLNY